MSGIEHFGKRRRELMELLAELPEATFRRCAEAAAAAADSLRAGSSSPAMAVGQRRGSISPRSSCSVPAYSVVPAAETAEEQRAAFARLRDELGSASSEEIRKVLDEREPVEPDPGWTPELRERFEARLAAAHKPEPVVS